MGSIVKQVAAVTGATGLVGLAIVELLLKRGWSVRVLTRSDISYRDPRIQVIVSDINNKDGLQNLLFGVDAIFHCAGETSDEDIMYSTNVEGTRNLLSVAKKSQATFFCYISSAGVVGPTDKLLVTEETFCSPRSLYEKTKYESEQMVINANLAMNTVILRPTNVVGMSKLGVFLLLPIVNGWKEKLKVMVTGAERAHIVYVNDVAKAALFFMNNRKTETNIYFVSNDDDDANTVSGIYNQYISNCTNKKSKIKYSFPVFVPYVLRKIYKGYSLHGSVQFSSKKIKDDGFVFQYSVRDCLRKICTQNNK